MRVPWLPVTIGDHVRFCSLRDCDHRRFSCACLRAATLTLRGSASVAER